MFTSRRSSQNLCDCFWVDRLWKQRKSKWEIFDESSEERGSENANQSEDLSSPTFVRNRISIWCVSREVGKLINLLVFLIYYFFKINNNIVYCFILYIISRFPCVWLVLKQKLYLLQNRGKIQNKNRYFLNNWFHEDNNIINEISF